MIPIMWRFDFCCHRRNHCCVARGFCHALAWTPGAVTHLRALEPEWSARYLSPLSLCGTISIDGWTPTWIFLKLENHLQIMTYHPLHWALSWLIDVDLVNENVSKIQIWSQSSIKYWNLRVWAGNFQVHSLSGYLVLQRVGHNWATELNCTSFYICIQCCKFPSKHWFY